VGIGPRKPDMTIEIWEELENSAEKIEAKKAVYRMACVGFKVNI
jgi:hypothetical protein